MVEIIAQALKDAGHEVVVITAGLKKDQKISNDQGMKVYRFYPWNIFSLINISGKNMLLRMIWHGLDMFNWQSYFKIKKILREEKPDVVFTHNLKGIGYLIPRLIKKLKIKHIHTIHDVQLSSPSGLIIKGEENSWSERIFLRVWYEHLCRWLFNSPNVIISPSKWLMDFYIAKGFFSNSKKVILPNPVDIGRRYSAMSPMADKINFLYVGQMEKHKGVLFLVEAFKNILAEYPTAYLNLVGEGGVLEEAKKIGDNPRIKFHDYLEPQKVQELYLNSQILVVPSLCYENSPTVIYEAFSYGLAVIASRIGGVTELIEEGVNGFTFTAGDEDDLFRAMKYCLDNRDKLAKIGETAKHYIAQFDSKVYIKKILELQP